MALTIKPQDHSAALCADLPPRSLWPRRAFAGAALGLGLLGAASAAEQVSSRDAQALRRACASGALTPYVCALRGVKVAGAPAEAAKTPSAPAAAAAPVKPTPDSPPHAEPPLLAKAPGGGPTVSDPKGRYSLEAPSGWTARQQGTEPSFAHGDDWIVLRVMPSLPPKLAATAGLNLLKAEYASFHVVAEAQANVGARRGYKTSVEAVTASGRNAAITVLTTPITRADNLVILAGGVPEHASAIAAAVNAVAAGLRFGKSAPGG